MSKYCQEIVDKYEIKVGDVKKLISNLGYKTNYVVNYRDLQLYLSLGMKPTKIHKVLKFKQSDWMKKHLDFNTEKRINATNDFKKDFFKLMINTVYGKTIENLQKGINMRLINNAEDFLKYTIKPTFFPWGFFMRTFYFCSLICVFVLFMHAKEKKIEKLLQCKCTKYRCPHN